jgi:hypothetical protein
VDGSGIFDQLMRSCDQSSEFRVQKNLGGDVLRRVEITTPPNRYGQGVTSFSYNSTKINDGDGDFLLDGCPWDGVHQLPGHQRHGR